MVNFYLIDTGLLIGYCNPLDYFHPSTVAFFREKDPRLTFLLHSIREEFYRKVVREQILFNNHILRTHRSVNLPSIPEVEMIIQRNNDLKKSNYVKYILNLLIEGKITAISYQNAFRIYNEYSLEIDKQFQSLIRYWIKRPHVKDYDTILQDTIYLNYHNIFTNNGIHEPDAEHLSAACYEIRKRNRRKATYEYYFYTTDKEWIDKDIDSCSGLHNFHVKLLPYDERISLGWSEATQSNSIRIIKTRYIPDGL